MSTKPNIVLICVDQWRGDCLSIAGHPVVHTPYLNQIALYGARFNRAYAACPSCIPARASLYTGLTPRTHGRVGYQDGVPWNYPNTIAGEFTRHGYQTEAIGKLHVFPERSQLGFQNVVLHDGYIHYVRANQRNLELVDDYLPWLRQRAGHDATYFDHGLECNSYTARPWDKDEALHPTNFIVTQGIDFLRRRDPRKPFFLLLSFHRPHPPFDPPAWALQQYLDQPMPDPPVGDWTEIFAKWNEPHQPNLRCGKLDPRLLHRARAGYYGCITHIDHQINRFMEALHEFEVPLARNTYLCFVSDHGDMLGDHHLFRKSLPYEGSARVPLILHGPAESGVKPNAAYDQVVELRDIMPTLLDCAGLPSPDSVEGRSFLPIARGESGVPWRDFLHGEHIVYNESIHYITDGHEKYVWFSGNGREQMFDLDHDPHELCDIGKAGANQNRMARWRRVLINELKGREEGFTDGKKLIVGRPVHPCLSHLRKVV
ncbi:MAG: arylsulfatase [Verrucomicrobia bacterium]|nr:arylsulfatase [Verrucomicrobiota bacterium]